jgi:hypothetical protein
VEHDASWRQQLRQLQLPDTTAGGPSGRVQVVPLLCELLAAVAPHARQASTPAAAAGAAVAGVGRRLSSGAGSGEVTVDCLEHGDDQGAHMRWLPPPGWLILGTACAQSEPNGGLRCLPMTSRPTPRRMMVLLLLQGLPRLWRHMPQFCWVSPFR